jgi:hypothetical protein
LAPPALADVPAALPWNASIAETAFRMLVMYVITQSTKFLVVRMFLISNIAFPFITSILA